MRLSCFLAFLCCWIGGMYATDEETLYLRRIADFYEEGETELARHQIEEFLNLFSESEIADVLRISLGDLSFKEQDYEKAIHLYSEVRSESLSASIFPSKALSLYYLGKHEELITLCEEKLTEPLDEQRRIQTTYFLAIALYQQASLEGNAEKALLQFESLLNTDFEQEILYPFSQLCSFIGQDEKGAQLLLKGAQKYPAYEEEFLFQAAQLQAKYAKDTAIATFQKIIHGQYPQASLAAYELCKLLFEEKKYTQLLEMKDTFTALDTDKQETIFFYIAQSLIGVGKYAEAIQELQTYLKNPSSKDPFIALSSLLEAFYLSNDLANIERTIEQLTALASNEEVLSKIATGKFFKSLLLKKQGNTELAQEEIETLIHQPIPFPGKAQATFEIAHLAYQNQHWAACREKVLKFLYEFERHELAPFAWHYLISSSLESIKIEPTNTIWKENLDLDLEFLLTKYAASALQDKQHWVLLQAKNRIELNLYDKAIESLERLQGQTNPDADLLLAICYRDGKQDLNAFCTHMEKGIAGGGTIIPLAHAHLSLFNAYLNDSEEKAAEHLYQAFALGTPISKENLLWLGQYCIDHLDFTRAQAVFVTLSEQLKEDPLALEAPLYHLIYIDSLKKELDLPLPYSPICQTLLHLYETQPDLPWKLKMETYLLVAEGYELNQEQDKACLYFDAIMQHAGASHTKPYLQALLHVSQMKTPTLQKEPSHPDFIKVATDLKNVSLQKTLQCEPIHWEATFEYLDLLASLREPSLEGKRFALLQKIKADFENPQDLLSRDYLKGKEKFPLQYQLHLQYMKIIDGEMLFLQSKQTESQDQKRALQEQARQLFKEVVDQNLHPFLLKRGQFHMQWALSDDATTIQS